MITEENIKAILNLYNYFNMAIITNEHGFVEYFFNNRPDINSITEKDVLGHNVLDSCVNLTEETSTIFYVLRTGVAINNQFQELKNSKGEIIYNYCTTMPIKDGDKIIGAVEVAKYVDSKIEDSHEEEGIKIRFSDYHKKNDLYEIEDLIGNTRGIERLKYKISCVANTDSTVLIYGETGTGKEIVAEAIHSSGKRRKRNFVSQNCAAIPPTLLEGILFGTEKGSFTGAENRVGLLESASGGTLFLDEINSMDINTQAKILKAIEEKQIKRVGGTESIPVDVRIIAAVNVEPSICLEKEYLREDLYYRLKVVELVVPPLRDRKEDLDELVEHFIKIFNKKMNKYVVGISDDLKRALHEYDWPGNVRELKNTIEGGYNMAVTPIIDIGDILANGDLNPEPINEEINFEKQYDIPLKETLRKKECELIKTAYDYEKNVTKAAERLNISRQLMTKKLKEYGIK